MKNLLALFSFLVSLSFSQSDQLSVWLGGHGSDDYISVDPMPMSNTFTLSMDVVINDVDGYNAFAQHTSSNDLN